MSECKKVKLIDTNAELVYHDEYGWKSKWEMLEIFYYEKNKLKIEVYEGKRNYTPLMPYQIKKGIKVLLDDSDFKCCSGKIRRCRGTYVVTEVFEQPNETNRLCALEPLIITKENNREGLAVNDSSRLYRVPYETYEEATDELSVFNQPISELELAPFLETTSGPKSANLYWFPIPEACEYTVSLYKYRNNPQQRYRLYLLQKFSVERNTCWLSLHDLIGEGYILMLEAENREGNIIARTRGINVDSGNLEWF